jgi:propanol-preferring alcohol dehydrogenase
MVLMQADKTSYLTGGTMAAARIHEYQQPLAVETVPKPGKVSGEAVLIRVGAAGLCHSDLHLINGDWRNSIPLQLPKTPGHEVAGWVEQAGDGVPEGIFEKDELVAVFGGWGCGICTFCKRGDEQLCIRPHWPGLSHSEGGYSEYLVVPSYRFLVKAGKRGGLKPEELAPLTDAGLTPYRAIKKVAHMLGPGSSIAIVGMGGLGMYGVQYASLLAPNSTVIAIDRNDSKLCVAENFGAEYTVNSVSCSDIHKEIMCLTDGRGVDVVVDTVGAENTIADSLKILAKSGALVLVGLFGSQIKVPLLQSIVNEYHVYGSLWGNYNELREVIELAGRRKIRHAYQSFPLKEINRAIESLKQGQILGRAVIVP